jgi:hypothetical protein
MTMVRLIEYNEASAEIRAVYDDIMTTRGTDWINNFWKALANDPPTLRRTWESIKEVMAAGALDPVDQGAHLSRGQRQQRLRLLHRLAWRCREEAGHDPGNARRIDGGRRHGQRNQQFSQRLSGSSRREVRKTVLMAGVYRRTTARPLSTG